jgi:hypothetical protein
MMVAVAMTMAPAWAQTAKSADAGNAAYVNKAEVAKAASGLKADISASGAAAGYVPVFTDASGDLGNSLIFQSVSGAGNFVGIGTSAPAEALEVSGTNPTLRIDNYSNNLGDSPNFNFWSARGTSGVPLATQNGDNLGQFAAAGYNGSAFPGSKVKVTFLATESWTTLANGTAMTFSTTKNGSTARTERLRIDNTGNVGIGTTTPAYPLSVNGVVQSLTGGFRFPDGTVQATAAVGGGAGVTLSSPDGSITVGGTAAAPTVEANAAVVQKRVTGTCAAGTAVTAVSASGTVTCAAAGGTSGTVPLVVANVKLGGSYGLGTTQTIYTATADGFYRVSVYMNVGTAGTCSSIPCAGEAVTIQWNDGVSTTALATANCNLVTVCGSSVVTPVWVKSGQTISAYGQSYGSGTAPTGGSYNAYVLVEQL